VKRRGYWETSEENIAQAQEIYQEIEDADRGVTAPLNGYVQLIKGPAGNHARVDGGRLWYNCLLMCWHVHGFGHTRESVIELTQRSAENWDSRRCGAGCI